MPFGFESSGTSSGGSSTSQGVYNVPLPTLANGASNPVQLEKDGTLRAGLRPRGFAAGALATVYQTGILITAGGSITVTGEDGVSSGAFPVPTGIQIPGPITVTAVSGGATFLGYK